MAQNHVLTDKLYVISGGKWILQDYSSLNDVAKYVVSAIQKMKMGHIDPDKGTSSDLLWTFLPPIAAAKQLWNTSDAWGIDEFYITSMQRTNNVKGPENPHTRDLAVDFVVTPLYYMPLIFNELARLYTGANIYIAAPLRGGDVPLHIHYDRDFSKHRNYKKIENEQTAIDFSVADITPDNAQKIINAYGVSPEIGLALPSTAQQRTRELIAALMSQRDNGRPDDRDPPEPHPFPLGDIIGGVIIGACVFGLVKMISSGELKSNKRKR